MEQIIKVDKSGNFKLPAAIKKSLKLKKDDNLLVFSGSDSILIKKMDSQSLKQRFIQLSETVEGKFSQARVTKDDVAKAVQWARK